MVDDFEGLGAPKDKRTLPIRGKRAAPMKSGQGNGISSGADIYIHAK